MKPRGSVIIVTWNRPEYMNTCLTRLREQDPRPDEIIVVDASPDDRTRKVVEGFPEAVYLFNEKGRGNTPHSRNVGIMASHGDILIFLDDDAFAHPGWYPNLMAAYGDDLTVGGVVARVLNNQPNEATEGADKIGLLQPTGVLTGHFAADPGRIIEVDHMLGACMSFRREAVARVGGFHGDYPGTNACDDSDMCLRVKLSGYRLLFTPYAVVDHVAAPRAYGKRFDARYQFYHRCNSFMMFLRTYGLGRIFWSFLLATIQHSVQDFVRRMGGAFAHLTVNIAGTIVGILHGIRLLVTERCNPQRHDALGQEITRYLEAEKGQAENGDLRPLAPIEATQAAP